MASILEDVCEQFNAWGWQYHLTPDLIKSKSRYADLVWPRQLTIFLIKKYAGRSHPEIANFMNMIDHTTSVYVMNKLGGKDKRTKKKITDWQRAHIEFFERRYKLENKFKLFRKSFPQKTS